MTADRAPLVADEPLSPEDERAAQLIVGRIVGKPDRSVYWRCFHCGDTFTKAQKRWAREHFGRDEGAQPVCLIRTAGETALLSALRQAEDQLVAYRAEDSAIMRSMWAMQADHKVALRREEEAGYAKGLRDARREQLA